MQKNAKEKRERKARGTCEKKRGLCRPHQKSRPIRRERLHGIAACGLAAKSTSAHPASGPKQAHFTLFLIANSRPQKRPCRTV